MKLHEPLEEQRARDIILAYGASPEAWPLEERLAVQKLLKVNASLQQLLKSEALLDHNLASEQPRTMEDTEQLAKRILAGLPARNVTVKRTLIAMITDHFSRKSFITATASIVFAVAVVIYNFPADDISQQSDQAFEQWAWQDITSQELVNENNTAELSFMDLIELEATDS